MELFLLEIRRGCDFIRLRVKEKRFGQTSLVIFHNKRRNQRVMQKVNEHSVDAHALSATNFPCKISSFVAFPSVRENANEKRRV